ncbi:restriction endonuclease subunit S [Vibrio sp. 10N.261.55.A7]|uniref:restriction endonuclease subunit S n=1 Tax=Vibrio sp. 10N.261.55.A7 TaxID=1880851 RepID=UPI001F52BB1F|nr:restriction endonuclease subunit S [Vibrio sp. 10N.261.55.A7]
MNQLITDNIDIWTSTVKTKSASGRGSSKKRELYGVKKLRELILELAVRGKLVPQDPTDEPASILLERIAEEKAQLVKDKKFRKSKKLDDIESSECPFNIPRSWQWCYLSDIGAIVGGGTPKSGEESFWTEEGVKWLTPADLYGLKSKYIGSGKRDITDLGLEKSSAQLLPKGSVLFSSRAPIGYTAIAANDLSTNQGFKSVVPVFQELSDYVYYFLKRSAKNIDAEASGTTFKEVSGAVVSKVLTPLPPLNEQHRIVAKVDELMTLCDQLEQQTEASIEAHQVLVTTLLDSLLLPSATAEGSLTNSADADELMQNWARISEHFDTLFTTEASIDQLKQTILQLAVMGKLVLQDPNDEPAAKLLERIAEEKAQLIKEKKIKKQKALPPIADDEKPFELPNGWEWCRLGEACRKLTDGSHNPPPNHEGGYPMLSCKEIYDGRIDFSLASRYVDQGGYDKENKRTAIKSGDVLLNIVASIGRSAIVPQQFPPFVLQRNVAVLDSKIESKFLAEFLMSPIALDYYDKNAKGTAQKVIYLGKLSEMLMPVPPRSEQDRIVTQLNDLMGICDQLKARLKESQSTQLHLTDAIVEQAV